MTARLTLRRLDMILNGIAERGDTEVAVSPILADKLVDLVLKWPTFNPSTERRAWDTMALEVFTHQARAELSVRHVLTAWPVSDGSALQLVGGPMAGVFVSIPKGARTYAYAWERGRESYDMGRVPGAAYTGPLTTETVQHVHRVMVMDLPGHQPFRILAHDSLATPGDVFAWMKGELLKRKCR